MSTFFPVLNPQKLSLILCSLNCLHRDLSPSSALKSGERWFLVRFVEAVKPTRLGMPAQNACTTASRASSWTQCCCFLGGV